MEMNFTGLKEDGVASLDNVDLIGINDIKEVCKNDIFNNEKIKSNDTIVVNVFGEWGLGKTHFANRLFLEINDKKITPKYLVQEIFAEKSICVILNYKFIRIFGEVISPQTIATAACFWLDEDNFQRWSSKSQIIFPNHRNILLNETKRIDITDLVASNSQYRQNDPNIDPYPILNSLLKKNNLERIIIIVDEIEEIEHGVKFFYQNIAAIFEQLINFVSQAKDSRKNEEIWRIGFVFLISQGMYERIRSNIEDEPGAQSRRFTNLTLDRYDQADMHAFLANRLFPDELNYIKPFMSYFNSLWEACCRNLGWFEVASKKLCLKIKKNQQKMNYDDYLDVLTKSKKGTGDILFNENLYYIVNNYLKDTPFQFQFQEIIFNLHPQLLISGIRQNLIQKLDKIEDFMNFISDIDIFHSIYNKDNIIIDADFLNRLKVNNGKIGDNIRFPAVTSCSIKTKSLKSSFFDCDIPNLLTYKDPKDYQMHLSWIANRKIDFTFSSNLLKCLDLQKTDYIMLSPKTRQDFYHFFRSTIVQEWLQPEKLHMILDYLHK